MSNNKGFDKNLGSHYNSEIVLKESADYYGKSLRTIDTRSVVNQFYTHFRATYDANSNPTSVTYHRGTKVHKTTVYTSAATALNNKYFSIYNAPDQNKYTIWFNVDGAGVQPTVADTHTYIEVALVAADTSTIVAVAIRLVLAPFSSHFTASSNSNVVEILTANTGTTQDSVAGTSGFVVENVAGEQEIVEAIVIDYNGTNPIYKGQELTDYSYDVYSGKFVKNPEVSSTVSLADDELKDSFGRLRISAPFGIFDNKNVMSKNSTVWTEQTSGGTETITHLPNESAVALTVGTASGEYAIRQALKYCAYVPGKSQLIMQTGVFGAAKTNVTKRIGYFDNSDGLFFEQTGTDFALVVRTSTSGSPVETRITQANWNKDKLDGTGKSGLTLDVTKTQIFTIDFQWLGVGRIRFGFDINGIYITVHEIYNANNLDVVFMKTPTLPIRFEIRNTGVTASSTTLKEICCSVSSEGGYALPGLEYSSMATSLVAVTTRRPVFAIRLANSFNGQANRKIARILEYISYVTSSDAKIELVHVHDPTSITGTFSAVNTQSGVEVSTDISAITATEQHLVKVAITTAGQGNTGGVGVIASEFISEHSYLYQNYDSTNSQLFVIFATSMSGTANIMAGINWIEFV